MTYLTNAELMAAAPAAERMKKVKDGLIDTYAFVRHVEQTYNHRPVMAVQGKPHRDGGADRRKRQGRHFIVMAGHNGNATILLNSHLVRRKAWVAAGWWRKEQVLIGVALPLQRWRGYETALEELERYRAQLATVRTEMRLHVMNPRQTTQLADAISATAYLPGHNPIAAEELLPGDRPTLYDTLFAMHAIILKGNAKPAGVDKRKVKPVKGPDALMQLGNAVFRAGVDLMGSTVALPGYRKT